MTQWIKSRSVGQVLSYLTVALVAIVGLVIYFTLPSPTAQAVDPIEIVDPLDHFTLDEPATGSQVTLTLEDAFVENGAPHTVEVTNVTLGETTNSTWSSGEGAEVTFTGGVGDLISVKVLDDETPQTSDTATLGYVPAPTDTAKPDLLLAEISSALTGSDFDVTVDVKGLLDQSWPCELELFFDGVEEDSTSVTQNNGSENTAAVTVSADGISTGDRLILRATDDYGNRTEVHLIANGGFTAASSDRFPDLDDYRPPASYCVAQKTGQHAVAGTGVELFARNFAHSVTAYSLKGLALPFTVTLNYRSTMDYNGPWGQGVDCSLDRRLDQPTTKYEYWPGDGLAWRGFTTTESPKGLFMEYTSGTNHRLTDAKGNQLRFDGTTGLLKQIRDGYGNKISVHRNADDYVSVVEDDLGRKIHFSWYDHGRLAAIKDFGGREVLFDYDTDGCLTKITRADGSFLSFDYTKQNSKYLMSTVYRATEAGETALVALENTYDQNDEDRVSQQRNMYNLNSFGDPIKFTLNPSGGPTLPSATDMDVVRVEDADGYEVDYGYDQNNGLLMCIRRHHDVSDPEWIDTWFEHEANNLLLKARYMHHKDQTGTPKLQLAREEWHYESSGTGDVVDRGRLKTHYMAGDDGLQTSTDPKESWTYGTASPSWPETHTDFNGVVTKYEYDGQGGVTKTTIENVTPVGGTAYDIVTSYTYDGNGRLQDSTNPNRNDATSTQKSVKYTYYGAGDGHQNGYLKKVERLSDTGSALVWTEYEYDVYGNVTRDDDQAGIVNEYEYDLLDRQTKRIWDQDFTHPDAPTAAQVQVATYVYEGDELVETWQTYYDMEGTGDSSNSTGGLKMSTNSWTECTSTTGAIRVTTRRYGLPADNTYDKSETEFDARGNAISRRDYYTTTAYTETESEYDALSQLIETTLDPDAVASDDEIVNTFAYDFAGRQIERSEPRWQEPERSYYDEYGRLYKRISTKVALGKTFDESTQSYGSLQYGYFTTLTNYSVSSEPFLVSSREEKAYVAASPLAPTHVNFDSQNHVLTAETKYDYDTAGRRTKTEEKYNATSYATTEYTLLPGGQTSKLHLPTSGTPADYTETKYDSLDRVTEQIDATGNNKTVTHYDSTTQLVEKTDQVVWDETASPPAASTYTTEYYYDNRGRVTEERRKPNGTGYDIKSFTAYDGPGNAARTWTTQKESATVTNTGMITERVHGVAGRLLEDKRGLADVDGDIDDGYAQTKSSYDAKGRETQRKRLVDQTASPVTWLTTDYDYDDADRVTKITHPPYGTTTRETTYTYSFEVYDTGQTPDLEVPAVTEEQPTGATGTTLRNQLGHPLETDVTDFGGTGTTVGGPVLLEFAYADSAACGCARSGMPVQARTFHNTDPENYLNLGDTIVNRDYYLGGKLESEELLAYDGDSWEGDTLEFIHDSRAQVNQVTFPDGTKLTYTYREDGLPQAMSREPDGGSLRDIATYKYIGTLLRDRLSYDGEGTGSSNEVATGGHEYDHLLRPSLVSWLTTPGSYYEESTSFTPDGLVTTRTRESTSGPSDSFSYGGANWLTSQSIETSPSYSVTTTLTRNNAGAITESKVDDGTSTNTVTYTYASGAGSAGYVTSISGSRELADFGAVVAYDSQNASNNVGLTETKSNRAWSYDKSGRIDTHFYDLDVDLTCNGVIAQSATWHQYDLEIVESSTYDFWGRRVTLAREGSGTRQSFECINSAPVVGSSTSHDLPLITHECFFDALGRRAFETVSGEYFAHLDEEIGTLIESGQWTKIESGSTDIMDPTQPVEEEAQHPEHKLYANDTIGVAQVQEYHGFGSNQASGLVTQYYNNPMTRLADKGYQDPDPVVSNDEALFTHLENLQGKTVAANAASCLAHGTGEGAFNFAARQFVPPYEIELFEDVLVGFDGGPDEALCLAQATSQPTTRKAGDDKANGVSGAICDLDTISLYVHGRDAFTSIKPADAQTKANLPVKFDPNKYVWPENKPMKHKPFDTKAQGSGGPGVPSGLWWGNWLVVMGKNTGDCSFERLVQSTVKHGNLKGLTVSPKTSNGELAPYPGGMTIPPTEDEIKAHYKDLAKRASHDSVSAADYDKVKQEWAVTADIVGHWWFPHDKQIQDAVKATPQGTPYPVHRQDRFTVLVKSKSTKKQVGSIVYYLESLFQESGGLKQQALTLHNTHPTK